MAVNSSGNSIISLIPTGILRDITKYSSKIIIPINNNTDLTVKEDRPKLSSSLTINLGKDNLVEIQKIGEKAAYTGVAILSLIWIVHLCAHIFAYYLSWMRNRVSKKELKSSPKVVIIKPLNGDSFYTFENLESYFQLDYGNYEIAFCIKTKNDPVYKICSNLMNQYKDKVKCRIFADIEPPPNVINPKVANMCQAWYHENLLENVDYIWISDQRCKCDRTELLSEMMASIVNDNGDCLFGIPLLTRRSKIWLKFTQMVENIYFGGEISRWVQFVGIFRFNTTIGMCMLINKKSFDSCFPKGIKETGKHLSEDHFIGQTFQKHGFKLLISDVGALQNHKIPTLKVFNARIFRWHQITVNVMPWGVPFMLMVNSVINSALACHIIVDILGWNMNLIGLPYLFCYMFFFYTSDFIMMQIMHKNIWNSVWYSKILDYFVHFFPWIYLQVINPLLLIKAMFVKQINWAGNEYHVKIGGVIEKAEDYNGFFNKALSCVNLKGSVDDEDNEKIKFKQDAIV